MSMSTSRPGTTTRRGTRRRGSRRRPPAPLRPRGPASRDITESGAVGVEVDPEDDVPGPDPLR
eukprot:2428330-Pyramimonas_sp.AAC.1